MATTDTTVALMRGLPYNGLPNVVGQCPACKTLDALIAENRLTPLAIVEYDPAYAPEIVYHASFTSLIVGTLRCEACSAETPIADISALREEAL